MAVINAYTRRKDQMQFTPPGTTNIRTAYGLNGPSEFGLEGLTDFTQGIADRQAIQDQARINEPGRVQVPLDANDPNSPMVYGGEAGPRSAYAANLGALAAQNLATEGELLGAQQKAEADKAAAETRALGQITAADIGAQGRVDAANRTADATRYAEDQKTKRNAYEVSQKDRDTKARLTTDLMTALDEYGNPVYSPGTANAWAMGLTDPNATFQRSPLTIGTGGPMSPARTPAASQPPEGYPDAQQGQDGKWYVRQNGQFYRID